MSCSVCPNKGSKLCSRCGVRRYCSAECQRKDWPAHKQTCSPELPVVEEDLKKVAEEVAKRSKAALLRGESRFSVSKRKCGRGNSMRNRAVGERTLTQFRVLEQIPEIAVLNERFRSHVRNVWGPVLRSFDARPRSSEAKAAVDTQAVSWDLGGDWRVLVCQTDVSDDAFFAAFVRPALTEVWFVMPAGADSIFAKFFPWADCEQGICFRLSPADIVAGGAWSGNKPDELISFPGPSRAFLVDWNVGEISARRTITRGGRPSEGQSGSDAFR